MNLRQKANTSSKVLKRLPYGTKVEVVSRSGGWCKVTYNGTTGYASAQFLVASNPASNAGKSVSEDGEVIYGKSVWLVTDSGDAIVVRSGASSSADAITKLASGSEVTLINTVNSSWYKVIAKGLTGFVAAKFVQFTDPNAAAETAAPAEDTSAYTTVLNSGKVYLNSPSASLHLRKTMSDVADITGTLKQGEAIEVLHYGEGDWLYVRCGSLTGYMHAAYARLKYSLATVTLQDADSQLIVRKRANKSGDMVTKLKAGTAVTVLSESGGWSKIRMTDGTEGYVSSDYLTVVSADK